MEILWQDVRYSVRSLLKTPGPTALVVLLMALGASLTVVVFTFLNAAIFRPLPFADSDRLVLVKESHPRRGQASLRPANFVDWKSQNECFEAATSSRPVRAELRGPEGVELIEAELALEDYFQVLGVPPLLGRTFEADDYTPTHERAFLDYANATFGGPTVVLSHGFWQRRFGGDPTVLGQALELNDVTLEIVGVMPPFFRGLAGSPTVWIPRVLSAEERAFRESHELFALARLAPGVSLDEATAEMQGLYRNLEQLYPAENEDWTAVLVPFRDEILGDTKLALVLVQLAALLVLLIGCINVATILTSRGTERDTEIRLRLALGATPARILSQALTESLFISLTGGMLALVSVAGAMQLLSRYELPTAIPFGIAPKLDTSVLGVAVGLSVLTGIVFGIAPALRASRLEPRAALRATERRETTRSLTIVCQIALAAVLLSTGGLVLRSLSKLQRAELGFEPASMLKATIHRPRKYKSDRERRDFQQRLLQGVKTLPGVEDAAFGHLRLTRVRSNLAVYIEGRDSESRDTFNAQVAVVSRDYFRTLGATLVKGRYFSEEDSPDAPGAIIVNETLAREFWPNEDALGRHVFWPIPDGPEPGEWFTVVGIIQDITYARLAIEPERMLYIPQSRWHRFSGEGDLLIRTALHPVQALESVRQRITEIDRDVEVSDAAPMLQLARDSLQEPRQRSVLLAVFAALALLMAACGLYGLLACSVVKRTREIGVRMALGARVKDVVSMVVGHSAALTIAGVAVGFAGSWGGMRLLASLLYGLSPADPVTYALAAMVLFAAAVLASYFPTRRATRIEPSVALRHD